MGFRKVVLPSGLVVNIPDDLPIVIPGKDEFPDFSNTQLQSLAYIPWDNRYLDYIPLRYKKFYQIILPNLSVRTTDIHTTLSVSFVPELCSLLPADKKNEVDYTALTLAVLLHDIGWGTLSSKQIADSLSYSEFSYSQAAIEPKKLHALNGAKLARSVIDTIQTEFDIKPQQQDLIIKLVRYHDQVDPWPEKPEPIEYLLLGDADRLWSYTFENFWLDTIRKNNPPSQYLLSLIDLIDSYFLTDYGRKIARDLIKARSEEVSQIQKHN